MITNFETNKVYMPIALKECIFHDSGLHLLNALIEIRNKVAVTLLDKTDDTKCIWVRDYMPIQVNMKKYVHFRYEPDYLSNLPDYKPNVREIISDIGVNIIESDINLDGGNVISCGDKVIMTDKIFQENPKYPKVRLIEKLSELLEAEIVLIPWDKYEPYGHSDGMVRYIGEGHVLLNNYCDFDKSLRKKLVAALSPHFQITELHYGKCTSNSWAYLNFLHVGNDVFVPMINEKTDMKAFDQIADAYVDCQCHPICQCEYIAKYGGVLNCITWNVYEDITNTINIEEDL